MSKLPEYPWAREKFTFDGVDYWRDLFKGDRSVSMEMITDGDVELLLTRRASGNTFQVISRGAAPPTKTPKQGKPWHRKRK